jgi:hypothetical protein
MIVWTRAIWESHKPADVAAKIRELPPGGRFAPRPPERADPEIEKDHHNAGSNQEHAMIWALRPTRTHAPQIRAKDDYRQKEENAGNFEPDDAANAPEGTEKAAHSAGNASAGSSGSLPCGSKAARCIHNGLGLRLGLKWSLLRRSVLCSGRKPLACHLASDAQPRAKDPANKLSSHTVYDGSSDAG